MSTAVKSFNPLEYSTEMKGAGMAPEMAEKQANLLNNAFGANKEQAASKEDLATTERLLRQDLQTSEKSLRQELQIVELGLRKDIAEVRSELKQDIAIVRQEMHSMENRLIFAMAKIVFGGLGGFSAIVGFLHYFKVLV